MCGIMGYVGPRPASPIILQGLKRLEYRGYDSAGVAVADDGVIEMRKAAGKLERLADLLDESAPSGRLGIGHTRWATHGAPTDENAHPHADPEQAFAIVHNGIIENFFELKAELTAAGRTFASETDTEVLVHLIADEYDGDLAEAVRRAVGRATGAYALVAMTVHEPDTLVAVRMISPLVIGFGDGETFLASGIPALLDHTREVLVMEDGEMVTITPGEVRMEKLDGTPVERESFEVDWDVEQAEKGGYPHFMLKEIFEQPRVIADSLLGRLDGTDVTLEDVTWDEEFERSLEKIWITACGTAFHAGLAGKEMFEGLLRVPTEAVYAHELRYRDPIVGPNSMTLAISQSGETADTLAGARLLHERGSRLVAITNVVGSALTHYSDDVVYTRAGLEISVASTKAYTAMLIAQYLLALRIGQSRGVLDTAMAMDVARALEALPGQVESLLKREEGIDEMARYLGAQLAEKDDIYFIGRGLDYAVATEGSLKLKEISYLHSEAMPAGELKHGTLALITEGTPVIVVNTQQHVYDKTVSALQEVKARGASVIAVAYDDDTEIEHYTDHVLRIPRTMDLLSPALSIVPLQLLAYHVADTRGLEIDQPRNLAKSVTVE
ncbi:MAG: glutamine--fructose-6-phosphate transaminase (isomerizing) [Acidimicrobiia bacterium]|nr:glutamine--fructose-6-phosphate transaminase (isomerizing) [Acidimicrobiia bacterium]MBT8192143.1 glutamine--fructose-6-phosphate transaminase (isomerizing) [Acidimicrobiia bacterium]MBT8248594.1 glutamine--fructose-6-phosphate transaminase (isomerizing) [Acidimicrobiia bacterium]NNF86962.1 glutamine--fructose-6-phosphate transaminase (isomerizing) [Acidimicrobiia bacterium]NNJ47933.1 glutamine--fructose-6-phosphate transaminase (isomerizing) [Acidimicrobiia bacterium]